jgi:hypothetical protein
MSALGQKQTFAAHQPMSALPLKADICSAPAYVRFVPIADIRSPTHLVGYDLIAASPVLAVTKRRNSAALVICRTAKLDWWGQCVHARRQRVGPLFRQIVEGAAVIATRSGPFFARLAIWQRPKPRRVGSVRPA